MGPRPSQYLRLPNVYGRGPGHWGWRGRMRQDWQRMTPEEREKLRATFSRRCGGKGTPESEPKA
jgi:hypothetical protein